MVEAAAGMGKSTLVRAAAERARRDGLRVLGASGSEFERDFAFGAVRRLFEPLLTRAEPAERARLLAGAAGPAEWVIDPGASEAPHAEAELAVLHAGYWLTSNVASTAPLLLVVDDLHWVDESSLRFLGYLARRLEDLPVALLVALRPAEPGAPAELLDAVCGVPEAVTLALRPLSRPGVAELTRAELPDATAELYEAVHAATAGNPLYVRELLRTVAAEGVPAADGATIAEASVPSLGERVMRRIDRVAPEAPALAAAMAVLGDGSRLDLAASLAGLEPAVAAGVAQRLVAIEILASADPFAFVHPLVRRSVYDGLTVVERDEAHLSAATLVEQAGAGAEAVAAHVASLRPAGSARVAAALRAGARDAIARAAPGAATRWLRRAIDEGASLPERAELLHELGEVEVANRDPAAIGHLREVLAAADQPNRRARAALVLAEVLVAAGMWDDGMEVIAEARAGLGSAEPEAALDLELFAAAIGAFDPRHVAAFDDDLPRLRMLARGESWGARALSALLGAVGASRGAGADEVRELIDYALRDGRLLAERGGGGWAGAQVLSGLVLIEHDERALEVIADMEAEAQRSGALIGMLTASGYRGWIHARRGDLVMAEATLRTPLEVALGADMALMVSTGMQILEDAMLERPSLDDVAAIMEGFDLDPAYLATAGGCQLLLSRAKQRRRRGELDDAVADLRACGATADALRYGPTHIPWRSELALALAGTAPDEARQLAADELAMARASGLRRPEGIALRVSGVVAEHGRQIDLLRDSVGVLRGSPARLELARSLVDLGSALRRRGSRVEARKPLLEGAALAQACGADRLLARAQEELRAAGAKPRRVAQSGAASLTASEQRVARLVAEGRSSPEVAQALFVSLKTVETHLSHVYAKLEIQGPGARGRLAEALAAGQTEGAR